MLEYVVEAPKEYKPAYIKLRFRFARLRAVAVRLPPKIRSRSGGYFEGPRHSLIAQAGGWRRALEAFREDFLMSMEVNNSFLQDLC